MTNYEKFKTAEERARAFDKWCHTRGGCDKCILHDAGIELSTCVCSFYWLDLEAEEEKPLPCPFCGGNCRTVKNMNEQYVVGCDCCCYASQDFASSLDAIAAHNRVSRAVMEDEKKEETP